MEGQRIHLYWDKVPAPDKVHKLIAELQRSNPSYRTTLWSFQSGGEYLEQHYGKAVRCLFEQCSIPAMQADFLRYSLLLNEGGAYMDADDRLIVPLDKWLDPRQELALTMVKIRNEPQYGSLTNSFLAGTSHGQLLAFVLGQCLANIINQYENNVWSTVGPLLLMSAIRYQRERKLQIIDPRHRYVAHFTFGHGNSDNHWSKRQKLQSIFQHTPEQQVDFSQIATELKSTNPSLYTDCINSIEAGFLYASYESQLLHKTDQAENSLQRLLAHPSPHFEFDDLSEHIGAEGQRFSQKRRHIDWRREFVVARLGAFEQRIDDLVQALSRLPSGTGDAGLTESPGVWIETARRLHAAGDTKAAIYAARRATADAAFVEAVWQPAARIMLSGRLYDAATAITGQILQYNPANAYALSLMAQIQHRRGNRQAAIEAARAAVAGDRYIRSVWMSAMRILDAYGYKEQARTLAEQALEHEPDCEPAINYLAVARRQAEQKRSEEAHDEQPLSAPSTYREGAEATNSFWKKLGAYFHTGPQ